MAKSLEEKLRSQNLLTEAQWAEVATLQERTKKKVEDILVDAGFLEEDKVIKTLADLYSLVHWSIAEEALDPEVVTLLPESFCKKHTVIPIKQTGKVLYLGTRDPFNFVVIDEAQNLAGGVVKPVLVARSAILKKLNEYREHFCVKEVGTVLKDRSLKKIDLKIESPGDEQAEAEQAPIINLVNTALLEGLKTRASDLHVQPEEDGVQLRFRVDGMLQDVRKFPRNIYPPLLSRIKIMANLDISEKRLPQDGQFSFQVKERHIDVRVSTLPTVHGEKAVLRLLDKSSLLLGLEFLGFSHDVVQSLRKLVHSTSGIIVITGPTGSGKTTTLYSLIHTINTPEKNITTVENPVEIPMAGIAQVQVKPKIGLDFAAVLRSVLRQDPDVILVGEIRDKETTEIALRASLTGHLVLATLHTNDSASCVARLLDMGAEPYLLATSLKAVLSQRLVRTICVQCREPVSLPSDVRRRYGLQVESIYRGKGCRACFETGYHGRESLGEMLVVDTGLQEKIMQRVPSREMAAYARENGMLTLRESAMQKVVEGKTTLEEVLRVTEGEVQ